MKALLSHLSKFISASLQIYAPLPFEFTADLHTLNAYLKTYTDKQQKLLEGFVNRLTEKLTAKKQVDTNKQIVNEPSVRNFDEVLKHCKSCTMKYPQLRLQLPTETSQKSFLLQCKTHSYRSSGRSKIQDGIKPNRHKFGTRDKIKQLKSTEGEINKQNLSIFANFKAYNDNQLDENHDDRSLKFIKSQAELLTLASASNFQRNVSMEGKEQKKCNTKPRYESNDNKLSPIPTQLKIRIKPRTTLQLPKFIENVSKIAQLMQSNDQEITNLLSEINFHSLDQDETLEVDY